MTRAVLVAWLLSLTAASVLTAALSGGDGAAAQVPVPTPPMPIPGVPAPTTVPQAVLKVGDTLRIEGAAMGCQVTRRGARPALECRRDGALAGTYGTFMTERTLTVARFRSSRTAQTILTARHGGRWRACGSSARRILVAAAGRGCR